MYAPTGALQSAVYGKTSTFAGITETRGYNNSLQLNGMSAASSAGTAINIAPSYNSNGEISFITNLGGHPKPANEGHLKTGQRE
jgi:hypothetical protein